MLFGPDAQPASVKPIKRLIQSVQNPASTEGLGMSVPPCYARLLGGMSKNEAGRLP